jgi:hypothetical protein
LVVLVAVSSGAWASEPGCYRTAEAAAVQVGVRGVDGYRLEGRRRDVFSGAVWSTVKSCQHPEQPGFLVMASAVVGRFGTAMSVGMASRSEALALVLLAGAKVTVVQTDDVVRIEMNGVAQGSGAVGDRIRVRIVTANEEAEERFVEGIVRGSDVVELVTR